MSKGQSSPSITLQFSVSYIFKLHNPYAGHCTLFLLHYIWLFLLPDLFSRLLSPNVVQLKFPNHLKACKMGIGTLSVCVCVWEWQSRQAGREGGCWTTYVNLSDRYVNNATHNYQGIKCVPCINKIMLRRGGKKRKTTEEKDRT